MRFWAQFSIYFISLYLTWACAPVEVTEREDGNEIAYPQEITGAYLANFDNSRVRCTYIKNQNASNLLYDSTCHVVVHFGGNEINANLLSDDTQIDWNTPNVSTGQVNIENCRVSESGLKQTCEIEAITSSANIDFSILVSSKNKKRKEIARILFPYSVEVAAGFVPNLPLIQTEQSKTKINNKYQAERNGFQVVEFPQDKMDFHASATAICGSSQGLYFFLGGDIYRLKENMIRHVAGGEYQIDENTTSDGLRFRFYREVSLACNSTEVYIREPNRIIALNHKTLKIRIVVNNLNLDGLDSNILSATESGLLYFTRKYDLVEFDTNTLKEHIFIKDFHLNTSINYGINDIIKEGFDFKKMDDGSYFTVERKYSDGKRGPVSLIKYIDGKIVTEVNNLSYLIGDDGKLYTIQNEKSVPFLIVSNGVELEKQKIKMDWTITGENASEQSSLKLLTVDHSGTVYIYDPKLRRVETLKADDSYQFKNNIPVSEPSGQFKSIFPIAPQFNDDGEISFYDLLTKKFNTLRDSSIVISTGDGNEEKCNAFNAIAFGPNGIKATSCENYISISNPFSNSSISIVGGKTGFETATEGSQEGGFHTKMPRGLVFDKNGTLYYADSQRIHKYENGKVEILAGKPEINKYGMEAGGFKDGLALEAKLSAPSGIALAANGDIYFADSGNNRIRRIFMKQDGKRYVETIAGNGEFSFSNDSGPALEVGLSNPTDLTMASDGTLYFVEGYGGSIGDYFNSEGRALMTNTPTGSRIRKLEWAEKDSKSIAMISTFFGGEPIGDCGAGKVNGKSKYTSISKELKSSISMLCQGIITGLKAFDNCSEENGYVDLAITQYFNSGYGNIIHVRQPCNNRTISKIGP